MPDGMQFERKKFALFILGQSKDCDAFCGLKREATPGEEMENGVWKNIRFGKLLNGTYKYVHGIFPCLKDKK